MYPEARADAHLPKWNVAWAFRPRWAAQITLIVLKSFKTQWNVFCQKYCFTKILHATGKSRKQLSWPLSHRPELLRKKEEREPPKWQGHRAKHQEPDETWEASPALGVYQPGFWQTLSRFSRKGGALSQQMWHELWPARPQKRNTKNAENNSHHT